LLVVYVVVLVMHGHTNIKFTLKYALLGIMYNICSQSTQCAHVTTAF